MARVVADAAYSGRNPWGVCWVSGAGQTWPHHPHHQIADLRGIELEGFWDAGPVTRADWDALDITLRGVDPLATLQSGDGVFHDDVEDYATNEPTIVANALGIALTARLLPPAARTPRLHLRRSGSAGTEGVLPSCASR